MEISDIEKLVSYLGVFGTGALIGGGIILLFIKSYLPSYLSEKAKNLATKQDIEGITRKVEEVKSDIEISKELQKQFLTQKQEYIMKFFDEVTEFHYEKTGVNFGDFPNDQGQSLFEFQNEFYKSVAEILKSYQRLVVFLSPESKLLGYANVLTSCVLESRKVMKENFGPIKSTAVAEHFAFLGEDRGEKRSAVDEANQANTKFWEEMRPSVEQFRENYRLFLAELNEFVKPNEQA